MHEALRMHNGILGKPRENTELWGPEWRRMSDGRMAADSDKARMSGIDIFSVYCTARTTTSTSLQLPSKATIAATLSATGKVSVSP